MIDEVAFALTSKVLEGVGWGGWGGEMEGAVKAGALALSRPSLSGWRRSM